MSCAETSQLHVVDSIRAAFEQQRIPYWLFGGWAVDFHVGRVTRAHDDIDLAVWSADRDRVAAVLGAEGWHHAPDGDENGYTVYRRDAAKLEVAFLETGTEGEIYTPLADGARGEWPIDSFGDDVASLGDVEGIRVVSLHSLKTDKAQPRDDVGVAAKDRRDLEALEGRHTGSPGRMRPVS